MSKNFIISQLIFVLILAFGGGVYFFNKEMTRMPMPIISKVTGAELIDANGKTFSLSELTGQVWVAKFFFTTCSDICPVMTKNMASLSRTFERIGDIKFVSITVNPEQDTPEQLKKYYDKVPQVKKNWILLTGSRETITQLMGEQFKLGSTKEPIFHSSYFSLVDRQGLIRGYYDGTKDEEITRLFKDASTLLKYRR